jgi:hypothetical protein
MKLLKTILINLSEEMLVSILSTENDLAAFFDSLWMVGHLVVVRSLKKKKVDQELLEVLSIIQNLVTAATHSESLHVLLFSSIEAMTRSQIYSAKESLNSKCTDFASLTSFNYALNPYLFISMIDMFIESSKDIPENEFSTLLSVMLLNAVVYWKEKKLHYKTYEVVLKIVKRVINDVENVNDEVVAGLLQSEMIKMIKKEMNLEVEGGKLNSE